MIHDTLLSTVKKINVSTDQENSDLQSFNHDPKNQAQKVVFFNNGAVEQSASQMHLSIYLDKN